MNIFKHFEIETYFFAAPDHMSQQNSKKVHVMQDIQIYFHKT